MRCGRVALGAILVAALGVLDLAGRAVASGGRSRRACR